MITKMLTQIAVATAGTAVFGGSIVQQANAASTLFEFAFDVDFVSSFASTELSFTDADQLPGSFVVDEDLIADIGLSEITILPGSDSTFSLAVGDITVDESDDVFGGPIIGFLDGALDSIAFDAPVIAASGESFFISLAEGFASGEPEFTLTSEFGAVEASGPLADAADVPEPATTVGLVLLGLGFLWKKNSAASQAAE
ncbi:MAG: PEP-CTERM sorting domain-containing protein [Cyanothece sp. SIO1E1]|nr:PEP-CTERM sorting domain-containing protein [Cyanothece sp. SIO1E1]